MATMLSVSAKTVQRRLKAHGLSITNMYNSISNETLDNHVTEVLQMFPNCGYRRMLGFLTTWGIRMQEWRVRESMHRVDHFKDTPNSNDTQKGIQCLFSKSLISYGWIS